MSHMQNLYGSRELDLSDLATRINQRLGVHLEFRGRPRQEFADTSGKLAVLRLYRRDGSALEPRTENCNERWFVSNVSEFETLMVAYGADSIVSHFHQTLIDSELPFRHLATYSFEMS